MEYLGEIPAMSLNSGTSLSYIPTLSTYNNTLRLPAAGTSLLTPGTAALDSSLSPKTAINPLWGSAIDLTGDLANLILSLGTAKVNAKSQADLAKVNQNIAQLEAQTGLSMAQMSAAAAASKKETMLYLTIGGIAVAGLLVSALMFR